ncbi:RING finger protein unkempt [Sarcoptes scabiei]|nr:RING finger protein unkempt [Sarcoptes scabiei]
MRRKHSNRFHTIRSISIWFVIISMISLRTEAQTNTLLRLCVPDSIYEDCLQFSDQTRHVITCINARDRFECMELIEKDEADTVNLMPEDLYLAGRLFNLEPFLTEEFNGRFFKQRAGVLIPKNSRIRNFHDLRNKRACLGPYNDIFQWKIPIGILMAGNAIIPDCRDELHSVENFFLEACAAGNWSSDQFIDSELKRKHRKLCNLCKNTPFGLCNENDLFAGQEGSIKCMLEGRGEVAFTTIETALDYFSKRPSEREHYEFLCLDGSRMAITPGACPWAKLPTNAFVIRKNLNRHREAFTRLLTSLFNRFVQVRPKWFDRGFVSSPNVTQLMSLTNRATQSDVYLSFLLPAIERHLQGCPSNNVTFCLSKQGELPKCQQLQRIAFAHGVRPKIRCYQADSEATCIRLLNERKADLMIMEPDRFYLASKYHSLDAVAIEETNDPIYSVAVVRSNSDLTMLSDLRGKRSCHTGFGHLASWTIPIGYLLKDQIVEPSSCRRAEVIVDYFGGSCVPGAADARINPNGTGVEKLCSQCIGDELGEHSCDLNFGERYRGEDGALRCLVEGRGDVAFLSHTTLMQLADGQFTAPWASTLTDELKASDFRLLCRIPTNLFDARTGGFLRSNSIDDVMVDNNIVNSRTLLQATVQDFERCHLARIPKSIIATSMFTPWEKRFEASLMLQQLSDEFLSSDQDSFLLSGLFRNRSDLMFTDNVKSLKIFRPEVTSEEILGEFLPFLSENDQVACRGFHLSSKSYLACFLSILSIILHCCLCLCLIS